VSRHIRDAGFVSSELVERTPDSNAVAAMREAGAITTRRLEDR
jgi:hypothetical protein